MGPDQNFLTQVRSAIFGLGLGNFPKKPKFSNLFPFGSGQRLVGLLFTAGQRYARVGPGPISSMLNTIPLMGTPFCHTITFLMIQKFVVFPM